MNDYKANAKEFVEMCDDFTDSVIVDVIDVIDGDTILVNWMPESTSDYELEFVVRLAFIDTPELHVGKSRRAAPYAREAVRFLKNFVTGSVVSLDKPGSKRFYCDPYGRVVAVVIVDRSYHPDWVNTFINLNYELVRQGYAMVYWRRTRAKADEFKYYLQAESEARAAGLGIWKHEQEGPVIVMPGGSAYHRETCKRLSRRTKHKKNYLRRTVNWAKKHGFKPCHYCMKG